MIYGSKKLLNSAKAVEFLAQEFALPEGGFLVNDKIYKDKDDVRSLGGEGVWDLFLRKEYLRKI